MRRFGLSAGAALSVALLAVCPALAGTIDVPAGGEALREALAAAHDGDTLVLLPGVHSGPVRIDKTLTVEGRPGAIVDGHGSGRVIEVAAPDVTIRGLTIRGSGTSLEKMEGAVFLSRTATASVVEDNRMVDNLTGVYVHGAHDAIVRGNRITGRTDLRLNEAGNGVYVWNAPGAKVIGNDITGGRDGIFTVTSRQNQFKDNRLHGVRFAVHYMYTNDSEVSGNVSIANHAGYVLMYSDRIRVLGNVSVRDRDHGILLNYENRSDIEGNAVLESGDKCVFIYNANNNVFRGNRFDGCRIGIHFTAGSEGNLMSGNAFVANRTQVLYVGTRFLDWSEKGRGNYWSDNPAFDLNGDGIADTPYRPNDLVDQVIWRFPAAKLLANAPATQIVRWAQAEFPAIHPGGVVDSAPLMTAPDIPAARAAQADVRQAEAALARGGYR
ncbi:MAG: nitrous oxide reductase family maturation protein NosD [Proteobacteria bacterium]|nr:nitrous oxide reductase family maturation protein NosD [Pseudomonadota bacterium]